MGFFGKHKTTETDAERQQRAEAAQAADQQYGPIVRDCLMRLQAWALPYSQTDGWEIGHVDAQGQRIVDVRVQLVLTDKPSFTVKAAAWQEPDLNVGVEYNNIALTAVDLYDALRRAVVEET